MVVISLTSIPPRFKYLSETLASLRNQTLPSTIILNIPYTYSRFPGDFTVPSFDGVIIHRCRDYGPATKLLGALDFLQTSPDDDQIVVVDDDHIYHPEMVETLLFESIRNPYSAITMKSCPVAQTWGIQPRGDVHYIAGFNGFLVQRSFFPDPRIFDLQPGTPQFYVDDIWISGFLELSKIPIYQSSVQLRSEEHSINSHTVPLYKDQRDERNKQTVKYFQSTYGIWCQSTNWIYPVIITIFVILCLVGIVWIVWLNRESFDSWGDERGLDLPLEKCS